MPGVDSNLTIGYVIGFIDAEASFSVSIKIQRDLAYGIRLDPMFSITQSNREPLELITKIIGAGRIIRKPGQKHLYLLVIDNMEELANKLIPFLDKYKNFMYSKRKSYEVFREIVLALYNRTYRDGSTLKKLVAKAYELSSLNSKARRKRSLEEISTIIDSYTFKRRDPPGER